MDARRGLAAGMAGWLILFFVGTNAALVDAAGYRTTNFEVTAATPRLAKEIGDNAEKFRRELAIEWLGQELPPWSKRCPIKAQVSPKLGAGGATSFLFDQGEVYGWDMNIQGSRERILDSVLPHEITHTIFASHFRCPLPRWADEGACTSVEHPDEVAKYERMLIQFLRTRRAIPFSQMMTMKEYPEDIMPLYAQGHSVVDYLMQRNGKRAFLSFLSDGMETGKWSQTVRQHYGYQNLLSLQNDWLEWVKQGRPDILPGTDPARAPDVLASAEMPGPGPNTLAVAARPKWPASNLIYRSKNITSDTTAQPMGIGFSEGGKESRVSGAGRGSDRLERVILQWHRQNVGQESTAAPGHVIDASVPTGSVIR
ncbi:MAG: hypothetical protein JW829_17760 [Pirellulales bacterium]|nr:hypothetical protein [Pirellulales bacterium]